MDDKDIENASLTKVIDFISVNERLTFLLIWEIITYTPSKVLVLNKQAMSFKVNSCKIIKIFFKKHITIPLY